MYGSSCVHFLSQKNMDFDAILVFSIWICIFSNGFIDIWLWIEKKKVFIWKKITNTLQFRYN